MDNVSDWQHPFVDVFKRYNTFDAPKSYKGSVSIVHVKISIKQGSCDCSKDIQIIGVNSFKQHNHSPRS